MKLVLTIRTDKPEAEIGLFKDNQKIGYQVWTAHRQLAETIHQKIQELLGESESELANLTGIVVFEGHGSFTGLRIGVSVANALAYGLGIPIIGIAGGDWIKNGLEAIDKGRNNHIAIPAYGTPAKTTRPTK